MQSEGWSFAPRNDDRWFIASTISSVVIANGKEITTVFGDQPKSPKARQRMEEQQVSRLVAQGHEGIERTRDRRIAATRLFRLRAFRVWIDPVHGWLVVDGASPQKRTEVIKLLLKCDKIPLESLRTKVSPQTAMTDWLSGNEAPKAFTIDQDTELRAHTEDKATVRYVRHSLDPEDVQRHIAAGKQCTKLAMTWDDKISFVLTETSRSNVSNHSTFLSEDKELAADEWNVLTQTLY